MDQPHLPPKNFSPLNIWAMSFGCSVGWGAFVLPGTTFLPIAGPLGSAIALILGALAMLVIAANYHFMAQRYPSAGGAFAYVRATLGDDHAFLCGWFLWLVYAAIIWANASALTLLVRNFFGNFLQFGFHYNLASYDIYLGEILFTAILIVSFGLICIFRNRLAIKINTSFALILIGLSLLCFLLVFSKVPNLADLQPAFAPEESKTLQIFTIMAFAPWAYVGFEAVSNVSQELKFDS
ncbi:MAG: APC family permease, partial [Desulfovibrionaceae bacterium]|nr:APC family permease [Desulfovibrionaceae bacterium]